MVRKNDSSEDWFSGTQVGTILEGLRKDISFIAEGVTSLNVRVERLEKRMGHVETEIFEMKNELKAVKDVLRIAIPDHEKRITRLETEFLN